jgi:ADP-ribose pyrophosphatase YjhB (NUDIX family)
MSFRRLLNVVYAVLVEARKGDPDAKDALDRQLNAKFDYELAPEERRREEARRMAEASGAIRGQQDLMESMRRQALGRA